MYVCILDNTNLLVPYWQIHEGVLIRNQFPIVENESTNQPQYTLHSSNEPPVAAEDETLAANQTPTQTTTITAIKPTPITSAWSRFGLFWRKLGPSGVVQGAVPTLQDE